MRVQEHEYPIQTRGLQVRRYGIHKLAAKVCHIHISPNSSLVAHVGDLTSDKSKSSEFNTLEQSPPFSFLLHREPNAVFFDSYPVALSEL